MKVLTFRPGDSPAAVAAMRELREESDRERHMVGQVEIYRALIRRRGGAPRVTGEFVGSITPYVGRDAVVLRFAQGGRGPQGVSAVRRANRAWSPGDPAGIGTADPAARKLYYGSSKQAKSLWPERAAERGLRKAGYL